MAKCHIIDANLDKYTAILQIIFVKNSFIAIKMINMRHKKCRLGDGAA